MYRTTHLNINGLLATNNSAS